MKNLDSIINGVPAVAGQTAPVRAYDLAMCSTAAARKRLGYKHALKWQVLPLGLVKIGSREVLSVVGDIPKASEAEQALQFLTDCIINAVPSDSALVNEAIFIAYRGERESLEQLLTELNVDSSSATGSTSAALPLPEIKEHSVPALVYRLIEYAISKQASDLSLTPTSGGIVVCTVRVSGLAFETPLQGYTEHIHKQVIKRIKILGGVASTDSDWVPCDGSFNIPLPTAHKAIRFHIFPTSHGLKVNLRLPTNQQVTKVSELGLSAKTRMFLDAVMAKAQGGIILSGPTGSGKTTTAYSVINTLACTSKVVVSLEDPIENDLERVSQTDLSRTPGLDYQTAIKHVMRQDPDVIFVGEVRDGGSAKAALEFASTGHLLVTALHSGRAFDAWQRLARLSSDRTLAADGVSLIITQRLLPKLCPACKVIDLASSRATRSSVYQAVGCPKCEHLGYAGRVLVDESLYVTSELKHRFQENLLTAEELLNKRYFHGLEESVQTAILDGLIDVESAKKIVS